ncbi:hypothetical protein QUB00_30370 [Microcoleus sp. F8_C2]
MSQGGGDRQSAGKVRCKYSRLGFAAFAVWQVERTLPFSRYNYARRSDAFSSNRRNGRQYLPCLIAAVSVNELLRRTAAGNGNCGAGHSSQISGFLCFFAVCLAGSECCC